MNNVTNAVQLKKGKEGKEAYRKGDWGKLEEKG